MEKVNIGMFYGFNIFIEVPKDMKDKNWSKMFENYIDMVKKDEREKIEQENMMKDLEKYKRY